jgi:hypothetical protein
LNRKKECCFILNKRSLLQYSLSKTNTQVRKKQEREKERECVKETEQQKLDEILYKQVYDAIEIIKQFSLSFVVVII